MVSIARTQPRSTPTTRRTPNLARGARGSKVSQLQQQLRRQGFNPGPVDGIFGPRTQAAVKALQRARGIGVDGIVGPQPRGALTGADAAPRVGARGFDVRELQSLLHKLGFNPGQVDGIFGPQTTGALRDFQRSRGITPTGNAGGRTWGALDNAGGGGRPAPVADVQVPPGARGSADMMVKRALDQQGDRYIFGAEVKLNDQNPGVFDCSELVQWAVHQAGGSIPDGSQAQRAHVRKHGQTMSIDQALRTRGALLFTDGHVAISLGDGRTIEARGKNYGVGVFNARGRNWKEAGTIPGLQY